MKKIVSLLLVLAMTLCLVACGGGNDKPDPTKAPANETKAPVDETKAPVDETKAPETEKVEINVVAAQYGPNTPDWWKNFVEEFNAANENINLTVECVSWNDIYTVVNTRIANNDAPDILNMDVFADYQADGLLLPAKDYVSDETYNKLYPAFLEQSNVDGTIWAIPDLASARALYYNVDLLKEAGVEVPTNWEELRAACETLKEYYKGEIYPWGVDMTTDEGQACFAYYTWNNGSDFVDAEGNWTLNAPENVEAAEYIVGLVKDGLTNSDPATETRYDLQEMFAAGKLAMMIGPNQISSYCASNENPINFAIAPIPTNGDKPSASAGVMDRFMCFDNGYSDAEIEAIKTFFDFFYEDQRYSDWVLMEDFLPATSTGAELVANANPAMASWIDIVGSCRFYPVAKAEWADVKQGVIDVLQQALLGENVQELLDALQEEIAG